MGVLNDVWDPPAKEIAKRKNGSKSGHLALPVDWYSDPKTEPDPPILLKSTKIIREDIPTIDIFGNFHVSTFFLI